MQHCHTPWHHTLNARSSHDRHEPHAPHAFHARHEPHSLHALHATHSTPHTTPHTKPATHSRQPPRPWHPDSVTPTRPRLLLILAVLATTAGWSVTRLLDAFTSRTLPVGPSSAISMTALTLALLLWTLLARPRLLRRPGSTPMPALVAARTAALALAASRTGALVLGGYAGIGIALLGRWSTDAGRRGTLICAATALLALAFTAVALWLERLCRITDDAGSRGHGPGPAGAGPGTAAPATRSATRTATPTATRTATRT